MARGKKKTPRRRKFKGINLVDAGLGYAGVSVWTNTLFGLDPYYFIMGQSSTGEARRFGHASGASKISIREIFENLGKVHAGTGKTELQLIQQNLADNWFDGVWKSATIAAVGTVGKRLTRKPRAFLNRTIRNFGLGDLIRV
jgi:hypothetical protein